MIISALPIPSNILRGRHKNYLLLFYHHHFHFPSLYFHFPAIITFNFQPALPSLSISLSSLYHHHFHFLAIIITFTFWISSLPLSLFSCTNYHFPAFTTFTFCLSSSLSLFSPHHWHFSPGGSWDHGDPKLSSPLSCVSLLQVEGLSWTHSQGEFL